MWSNGRADSIEPRINWHFKWESEAVQRRAIERRAGETALHCNIWAAMLKHKMADLSRLSLAFLVNIILQM